MRVPTDRSRAASNLVRITDAYNNYTPPIDARVVVARLLNTVPEKFVRGLDSILLTNEAALPRRDRRGKVSSRKRKYDKTRIAGRYHPRYRGSLPYIELRVDKILAVGRVALRIPAVVNLIFGDVLFHEIGHHIHYEIRPEHAEKEDVADSWGKKLGYNFIRKHYWYALPILIPIGWVYKFIHRKKG
jgi:hypothetical protein